VPHAAGCCRIGTATYHAHFASCFPYQTQRLWSEVSVRGLLLADVPRKNVEAVALQTGTLETRAAT